MIASLEGRTIGRLTVVRKHGKEHTISSSVYRWLWECLCTCGRVIIRSSDILRYSGITNCGRCNIPLVEDTTLTTDYQKDRLQRLLDRMSSDFDCVVGDACTRVLYGEKYLIEALDILGQEDIIKCYNDFVDKGAD